MPKLFVEKAEYTEGFTILGNDLFRNPRLSGAALKLLGYTISAKPGWPFLMAEVLKRFKEDRDAIKSAMKNLHRLGHFYKINLLPPPADHRLARIPYLSANVEIPRCR